MIAFRNLRIIAAFAACAATMLCRASSGESFIDQIQAMRELSNTRFDVDFVGMVRKRVFVDESERIQIRPPFQFHHGTAEILPETRAEVIEKQRTLIKELSQENAKKVPAPLLGFLTPNDGNGQDLSGYIGLQDAVDLYDRNPSSALAVVYLELALNERKAGQLEEYAQTLHTAAERLKLSEQDFAEDLKFRLKLPEPVNFSRPETCILFLLAEEHLKQGQKEEAQEALRKIMEIDPAGPLSWESACRIFGLTEDNKVRGECVGILRKILPTIWGCPRRELMGSGLSNDQIADQLLVLLLRISAGIQ